MFSKTLFMFVLLALSATSTSLASPAPGNDPEVQPNGAHAPNSVVVPPANAGHPEAPVAPVPTESSNNTTGSNDAAAAHPPAPAPVSASPGSSKDAPPTAHSSPLANSTASDSNPKTPSLNTTATGQASTSSTPVAVNPKAPAVNASSSAHPENAHPEPKAVEVPSAKNATEAHPVTPPTAKNSTASPPAPPAHPVCFKKSSGSNGIESHHCEKALDKIIFAANDTLDQFSSLLFVNYKTCTVRAFRPKKEKITKLQLTSMVKNITDDCPSRGGTFSPAPKIAVRVEHGKPEHVYSVDRPICKHMKCPLTTTDCLSAFHQIPENNKSVLIYNQVPRSLARLTSGNCTVTLATTDLSAFTISREMVYGTFKKLLNECGNHPGKIYYEGGVAGYNGDIKVSIRPANEELCS